jgi:hypothetical protein
VSGSKRKRQARRRKLKFDLPYFLTRWMDVELDNELKFAQIMREEQKVGLSLRSWEKEVALEGDFCFSLFKTRRHYVRFPKTDINFKRNLCIN